VNLAEVAQARLDRRLRRLGARGVEELQVLIGHRRSRTAQAARRRFSISESIDAALGFTTQNLGRNVRRSFRISSAKAPPVPATAPELRTAKRSPATPAAYSSPPVAP